MNETQHLFHGTLSQVEVCGYLNIQKYKTLRSWYHAPFPYASVFRVYQSHLCLWLSTSFPCLYSQSCLLLCWNLPPVTDFSQGHPQLLWWNILYWLPIPVVLRHIWTSQWCYKTTSYRYFCLLSLQTLRIHKLSLVSFCALKWYAGEHTNICITEFIEVSVKTWKIL